MYSGCTQLVCIRPRQYFVYTSLLIPLSENMNTRNVLVSIIFSIITAGCSGTHVESTSSVSNQTPQGQMAEPSPNGQSDANPLRDPGNILFKRGTYFDFNRYTIKSEYRSIIVAHAKYLKAHPEATIVIQGNCDERGSRKYNLALGLKRANAVKQVISAMGVPDKQIAVVSFGKDRPDAKGHDEKSWALNRRADIVYNGESQASGWIAPQNVGYIAKLAFVGK